MGQPLPQTLLDGRQGPQGAEGASHGLVRRVAGQLREAGVDIENARIRFVGGGDQHGAEAAFDHVLDEVDPLLRDGETPLGFQLFQHVFDHLRQELKEIRVLDEIVPGAPLHHFHSHALVALTSDDDEGRRLRDLRELADEFFAFDILEFQVEDHEVGPVPGQPVQRLAAGSGRDGGKILPPQRPFDEPQQPAVIVHDEDRWLMKAGGHTAGEGFDYPASPMPGIWTREM